MTAWKKVECPVCHAWLFEAVGMSAHLRIRIVCRCRRKVMVKEGFIAEVIDEHAPSVKD
jgi:hypothetical protein